MFALKLLPLQSEESVDNELCYYKYVEGEVEGEVTSVEVEYELECEDQPQHYGAYGKDKSQVRVIYNLLFSCICKLLS